MFMQFDVEYVPCSADDPDDPHCEAACDGSYLTAGPHTPEYRLWLVRLSEWRQDERLVCDHCLPATLEEMHAAAVEAESVCGACGFPLDACRCEPSRDMAGDL